MEIDFLVAQTNHYHLISEDKFRFYWMLEIVYVVRHSSQSVEIRDDNIPLWIQATYDPDDSFEIVPTFFFHEYTCVIYNTWDKR